MTNLLTKKKCAVCGGAIVRKGVDAGFASASALGRAAGAKGADLFTVTQCCAICGGTDVTTAAVACHICGGQATERIDLLNRNEQVTGIRD